MAGISKVGKKGLQDGALTTTAASAPTVGAKGELFYNTAENKLYVSNGTAWTRISNDAPSATGGTVVISTLNEGATFSYNLGTNFTDDANTDAELTYSLESGTLPSGCTLPTTGNSAMTGTVGNVSSNTVYTFSIRATDVAGATATQDYQQQINTAAATVTGGTVTISSVNEGSSASYDVDANFTFGVSKVFSAYSLQSGALPSGLSLNTSTGVISGTMGNVTANTVYSFTIRGTDTDGDFSDQNYQQTIVNLPRTVKEIYTNGGMSSSVTTYNIYPDAGAAVSVNGVRNLSDLGTVPSGMPATFTSKHGFEVISKSVTPNSTDTMLISIADYHRLISEKYGSNSSGWTASFYWVIVDSGTIWGATRTKFNNTHAHWLANHTGDDANLNNTWDVWHADYSIVNNNTTSITRAIPYRANSSTYTSSISFGLHYKRTASGEHYPWRASSDVFSSHGYFLNAADGGTSAAIPTTAIHYIMIHED